MADSVSQVTAILLCGGKGERLRPFTETMPKAMVTLNDEPLLSHLLRYLIAVGIKRFIVCVGDQAAAIESFLSENYPQSEEIICVNSGDASMTDRLLDARRHFAGRALVCYGDTLANVDLVRLLAEHGTRQALATLTVYQMHSPFGVVSTDEAKRITGFQEKPQLPYWINIGFLLCEPPVFEFLKRGSDMPTFLSALSEAGVLYAHEHTGEHLTVNTEKDRALAETDIKFFTYPDRQAE